MDGRSLLRSVVVTDLAEELIELRLKAEENSKDATAFARHLLESKRLNYHSDRQWAARIAKQHDRRKGKPCGGSGP